MCYLTGGVNFYYISWDLLILEKIVGNWTSEEGFFFFFLNATETHKSSLSQQDDFAINVWSICCVPSIGPSVLQALCFINIISCEDWFFQLCSRKADDYRIFWRSQQARWCLIVKSLPFSGFPLPHPVLLSDLSLGSSNYHHEIVSARKNKTLFGKQYHMVLRTRICSSGQFGLRS